MKKVLSKHIDKKLKYQFFLIIFLALMCAPTLVGAASLSIGPATGAFTVGSTFDISLFLNTDGSSINALELFLKFPPEKLQIVSPSIGKSIVGVWIAQPQFDNLTGNVRLQGGIPGGIATSRGLITTITFRVKSVGQALVQFLDDSKVLLNDGLGTNSLSNVSNAVYQLILPPPAGPIVVSETHPNQSNWYSSGSVIFRWESIAPAIDEFSYVLDSDPITIPDNISEGKKMSVVYGNVGDGNNYFHIKSFRNGIWGGTTHFSVRIDTTPPALFPVKVIPSRRTTQNQPIIEFRTTDAASGVDRYELKIVPLSVAGAAVAELSPQFFIEAESPYVSPPLTLGAYDVIVRAYDKAQNRQEVVEHLKIVTPIFQFIGDKGFLVNRVFTIPWIFVFVFGIFTVLVLGFMARRILRWREHALIAEKEKRLPGEVRRQLEELKKYRAKYGTKMLIALFVFLSFIVCGSVEAESKEFSPPLITTVSQDISNEEIFYVGGETNIRNATIIVYLQNLETGETTSQRLESDNNGEWFYRHDGFLSPGNYLLWTQGSFGEKASPPSAQIQISVKQTAIQFGANRLSYEAIYLAIVIVFLIIILGLIIYIIFHFYHGSKKHKEVQKQAREAEESVRRGFAVLRRDIEAELAVIRKVKLNKTLSEEEKNAETQLSKDLTAVQQYIGKEIWDIEHIA